MVKHKPVSWAGGSSNCVENVFFFFFFLKNIYDLFIYTTSYITCMYRCTPTCVWCEVDGRCLSSVFKIFCFARYVKCLQFDILYISIHTCVVLGLFGAIFHPFMITNIMIEDYVNRPKKNGQYIAYVEAARPGKRQDKKYWFIWYLW